MFIERRSQMESIIFKQLTAATIILGLAGFAAPALAGGSEQNSAQSAYHSGQASSHGSAAIASGAATVVAVPIIVFGAGIAISGAALAEVGAGSVAIGSDLARAANGVQPRRIAPNPAPHLD